MGSIVLGWLFGLVQGARHAFEPDHVAAVSTVIAEQRSGAASVFYAAAWGAGHALMLLVAGGALLALRAEVPPHLADAFELVVAVMLVYLGARSLHRALKGGAPHSFATRARGVTPRPQHDGQGHAPAPRWTLARRPLVIGLIHGLAGSGGLTALAVSSFASVWAGLLFLALYGAGAMLGMAALAGLAGVPLARLVRRPAATPIMMAAAGLCSLSFGVVWGMPILSRWLAG